MSLFFRLEGIFLVPLITAQKLLLAFTIIIIYYIMVAPGGPHQVWAVLGWAL